MNILLVSCPFQLHHWMVLRTPNWPEVGISSASAVEVVEGELQISCPDPLAVRDLDVAFEANFDSSDIFCVILLAASESVPRLVITIFPSMGAAALKEKTKFRTTLRYMD
ncbi:hypothetical protein Tco_0093313 [Tanacetum coccineum]